MSTIQARDDEPLRRNALERGVLGDPTVRDASGRLTDFWSEVLRPGDRVYVCAEDGAPEIEVEVVDEDGALLGVPTGHTRPCQVGRD